MDQVVLLIIVANVLFSYKGLNDGYFFEKYKFQIGPVLSGQKIRLLSSGFLHVDYMHLGFNMYALYIFSGGVIHYMGVLSFVLVYFGSLLAGNFLTILYHKNEPHYSAVGASGAVSGIVYAAILLQPNMTLYMLPIPFPIPAYVFGVGYLLYSIYGMKKQLGNVGHAAHLGGAIGGFVLSILLYPDIIKHNLLMVGLLSVPIVLLLILDKTILK